MTSQSGQQIITIHILSNISRSKCNQTVVEKLVPDNFMKNQN